MATLKLVARFLLVLFLAACGGGSMDSQSEQAQPHRTMHRLSVAVGTGTSRLDQTPTGFFYPTGEVSPTYGAGWLTKDPAYFSGEYHLGVDIMRDYGKNVYAIADGMVRRKSQSGWGTDNCALAIEHKTGSGEVFVAIYGHLLCTSVVDERQPVIAGKSIGKVGSWTDGDHLHFGIHPGPFSTIAASQWGRQFVEGHWSNPCEGNRNCDNGMTDPIVFILSNYAYNPSSEKQVACQGNICWSPKNADSCEVATSWYKGADYPVAQQGMPWLFEVDSRACGDIRSVIAAVEASENPSQAVLDDPWWRTFVRFVRSLMSVEVASAHDVAQAMANTVTINTINIYTGHVVAGNAARAGNGAGQGYEVQPITPPAPEPPDFVTKRSWLETPWGVETYRYGQAETLKMKGQFKNEGDGPCLPTDPKQTIIVHAYLSKGYKEDAHSDWKLVGTDEIQCRNLKPGDTHTETEGLPLSNLELGIHNIVWCIDHPQTDHNNGGDHPEKHESNNCSTEAVFEVIEGTVNVPSVDLLPTGLTLLQAPTYAGGPIRLGAYVRNQGTMDALTGIRSTYSVACNGGPAVPLTDDGTDQAELKAGGSQWEEMQTAVPMPDVVGICVVTFTVDVGNAQTETDETNNTASLTFTLLPRPLPDLIITYIEIDPWPDDSIQKGKTHHPTMKIKNVGTGPMTSGIRSAYYWKGPSTGYAWRQIADDGTDVQELCVGCEVTETIDSGFKESSQKGTYYLMACADYQGNQSESNEGNNCMVSRAITVK